LRPGAAGAQHGEGVGERLPGLPGEVGGKPAGGVPADHPAGEDHPAPREDAVDIAARRRPPDGLQHLVDEVVRARRRVAPHAHDCLSRYAVSAARMSSGTGIEAPLARSVVTMTSEATSTLASPLVAMTRRVIDLLPIRSTRIE